MIKKLRVKFIVLTMCSLTLVLAVIIGGVNYVNYRNVVNNADTILEILEKNSGRFPDNNNMRENEPFKYMSPEIPYESRFFSVLLDGEGNVISADMSKIAAVDTPDAIDYAQNVFLGGNTQGFIHNYRYTCYSNGDVTRIIFLDCGRNLNTFRTFLFASIGISLLGILSVFILIVIFSKRIIRPVSESYEKQKRFITDAGHEIKTPLTIIEADADILEMDLGENEWLQDIVKQTRRLTALTNDLVYLSRMEENRDQFQMVDFPLSDVVSETAQSFQGLAKTQNKTFTIKIQPMLSFYGDEKAIRQLVSILLDNALKYSPEEGSITLTLEKQGRSVSLIVYNTTWDPMQKDNLEALFDRFYRTDTSRNSQTGGYGIGLSIAKAIVSAHKGKITASTTKDAHSLTIRAVLPS